MIDQITKREVINSYDKAYSESDHLRDADILYAWVLSKLKPVKGARLLDVACGLGILVRCSLNRGLITFGVDLSDTAIRISRTENPNALFNISDGENLPFSDESFDYITNIGSLEHFFDMNAGLSEMHRLLKKDGMIAVVLPNSYYLVDIIWKVWRTGYPISHRQIIERFATYNQWKDLLEENGFTVVRAFKYNHLLPRSKQDWNWYFHHPQFLLLALIGPFIPMNLSYHFLYLCKKG